MAFRREAKRFELFPYSGLRKKHPLRTGPIWEFSRLLLFEYFQLFHGLRYTGTWNVPEKGPIIFAPNHVSYFDPPLVNAGIPFRVRSMAWDALFKVPGLSQVIRAYGAFPVKLKSADKSAVAESLRVLRNGECLLVFPEGERTESGELSQFEKGVARVALQTGATIVPVSITGAYESWPRARAVPMPFKPICVKFHEPIRVEITGDREMIKQRTEEINEAIAKPINRRLKAWQRLKRMKGNR